MFATSLLALPLVAPNLGFAPQARESANDAEATALVEAAAVRLERMGYDVRASGYRLRSRSIAEALPDVDAQQDDFFRAGHFAGMIGLYGAFGIELGATPELARAQVVQVSTENLLAYYQFKRKELVLISDPRVESAETAALVTHELVHAARDARTPAGAFLAGGKTLEDARVRQCLMEGEAEIVSFFSWMPDGLERLQEASPKDLDYQLMRTLKPAGALIYEGGAHFMLTQVQVHGWESLDGLFAQPPTSTEQILHPEKLGRDLPTSVDLGAWPAEAPAAKLAREDVLGEQAICGLLFEVGVAYPDARLASIGWDGDRMRVYALEEGGTAFLWRTLWDRAEDAKQFAQAVRGSFRGRVRQRDRYVDLVHADSRELLRLLDRTLRKAPRSAPEIPQDAQSTRQAEQPLIDAATQRPFLADGWWVDPGVGFRLEAPEGWTLVESGGESFLMAPAEDGFRDNLRVFRSPNTSALDAERVRALVVRMDDRNTDSRVESIETRKLHGSDAVVRETYVSVGGFDVVTLTATLLRGDDFVVLECSTLQGRWAERLPFFNALLEKLELTPELPDAKRTGVGGAAGTPDKPDKP